LPKLDRNEHSSCNQNYDYHVIGVLVTSNLCCSCYCFSSYSFYVAGTFSLFVNCS